MIHFREFHQSAFWDSRFIFAKGAGERTRGHEQKTLSLRLCLPAAGDNESESEAETYTLKGSALWS